MKPAGAFSAVDQTRFRRLALEPSQVPAPGRVMFCRGRKVLGYGDVSKLADFFYVPKDADTLCLSAADFVDVKGWIWS
jgi:hypothetical protein